MQPSARQPISFFSRGGFTLVEIMIVVGIIALLAALAIPAVKKVRNTSIEKTILNDARQVASAFAQYTTDTAAASTTLDKLVGGGKFIVRLSAGTLVKQAAASTNLDAIDDAWGAPGVMASITLANGAIAADRAAKKDIFSIGNANYDTAISSNRSISTDYGSGCNFLVFAASTGSLLKKSAIDSADVLTP